MLNFFQIWDIRIFNIIPCDQQSAIYIQCVNRLRRPCLIMVEVDSDLWDKLGSTWNPGELRRSPNYHLLLQSTQKQTWSRITKVFWGMLCLCRHQRRKRRRRRKLKCSQLSLIPAPARNLWSQSTRKSYRKLRSVSIIGHGMLGYSSVFCHK